MPFYSDEVIKNIEEEFRLFLIDKSQYAEIAKLISIIAPNNTLQTQLYHFAYHGLLRRIQILNRCIENIFSIRDFHLETIPTDDELSDIMINLQCFIINLYGTLENLAWIYAICINFKGTKFDNSFFAKQETLLNTLPENIKTSFIGDGKWLKHVKNIRDLLAHQEPLYVPPYSVRKKQKDKWQVLEKEKWEIENNFIKELYEMAKVRHSSPKKTNINELNMALQKHDELETKKNETISKINAEQSQYIFFCPILITETNKKTPLNIQFYPQILIDIKTVYEKVLLILEHIVAIKK
ncbi:MAG: hypothetical protein IJ482_01450 [Alphaproteobacteria bacterium]|nr:hypothetical protein [Alphaproteobacteria bacterium]